MKRIAIIAAAAVGSVAAVLVVAIVVLVAGTATYTAGTTFDEPPAAAPLSRLQVTRTWGAAKEVFATVAAGYPCAKSWPAKSLLDSTAR